MVLRKEMMPSVVCHLGGSCVTHVPRAALVVNTAGLLRRSDCGWLTRGYSEVVTLSVAAPVFVSPDQLSSSG